MTPVASEPRLTTAPCPATSRSQGGASLPRSDGGVVGPPRSLRMGHRLSGEGPSASPSGGCESRWDLEGSRSRRRQGLGKGALESLAWHQLLRPMWVQRAELTGHSSQHRHNGELACCPVCLGPAECWTFPARGSACMPGRANPIAKEAEPLSQLKEAVLEIDFWGALLLDFHEGRALCRQ